MSKVSSRSGFTLIELLVSTTILAVLLTIVAVSFRKLNATARDTKRKADIQEMRGIIENYRAEMGTYPDYNNESGGYEYSADGNFLENIPADFMSHQFTDPLVAAEFGNYYYYRYRVHNLPGCTYELSARMESSSGQSCASCGVTDASIYCVSD